MLAQFQFIAVQTASVDVIFEKIAILLDQVALGQLLLSQQVKVVVGVRARHELLERFDESLLVVRRRD